MSIYENEKNVKSIANTIQNYFIKKLVRYCYMSWSGALVTISKM